MRRLYQIFADLRTGGTPRLGTDGTQIVYPFRGIVQGFRHFARHPRRRTLAYVAVLVTAALVTAGTLVVADYRLEAPLTVLALAVAGAVAERSSVRITKTTELSISALPTLVAAVLLSPLAAGVVGAASMLGDPELVSRHNRDRAPRLKWATYTSTRFIGGAATGLAAQATLSVVPSLFGGLIAATLVGAFVGETLDLAFAVLTAAVRGRSMSSGARTIAPSLVLVPPLYAPIVALLAFMYVEVSPWTLALFLAPAIAAQRLYGLYQQERQLAGDLSFANETLERANLQFAAALIATARNSVVNAPWPIRASRSRPRASVPNGCVQEGGWSRAPVSRASFHSNWFNWLCSAGLGSTDSSRTLICSSRDTGI